MLILSIVLGLLLGSALTIFALENASIVTVSLFAAQLSAPLALLLIAVAAFGAAAGLLMLLPAIIRNEKRIKTLEKEKRAVEAELAKYSIVIPVAPPSQVASPISAEPRERVLAQ